MKRLLLVAGFIVLSNIGLIYADVLLIELGEEDEALVLDYIRRGDGELKPAIEQGGASYHYECLDQDGNVIEEGDFSFPQRPYTDGVPIPERRSLLLQIPWKREFATFRCQSLATRGASRESLSFSIPQKLAQFQKRVQVSALQPESIKISDNGPDEKRLTIVFVGEGYAESDQSKFESDVSDTVKVMFRRHPWRYYRDLLNIYYIRNSISTDSGIGIDSPRNTLFRLYYYYGLNGRLIWSPSSETLITRFLSRYAPASFDFAFVLVNDQSGVGGSGGLYPIFNLDDNSIEIALHEFGHSFAFLADEYVDEAAADRYTFDPNYPNVMEYLSRQVSRLTNNDLPWGIWIEPGVSFPGAGSNGIGLFEGAFYHAQGYYRPKERCLMRGYGVDFCDICTEAHVVRLYDFVSTIDSVSPSDHALIISENEPVEFSVIKSQLDNPNVEIEWIVDGIPVGNEPTYTLDPINYNQSTIDLTVDVRDRTDLVRHDPLVDGSYNPATGRGIHRAEDNRIQDSRQWNIQIDIPTVVRDYGLHELLSP